ncbi:MAG TPA: hypothetical protein VMW25_00270 [Clostridia bacterium]|nr:hypothetical protein [Clostridia bacterium]
MQITVRADVSPEECNCGSISVTVDGVKAIDIDLAALQLKEKEEKDAEQSAKEGEEEKA